MRADNFNSGIYGWHVIMMTSSTTALTHFSNHLCLSLFLCPSLILFLLVLFVVSLALWCFWEIEDFVVPLFQHWVVSTANFPSQYHFICSTHSESSSLAACFKTFLHRPAKNTEQIQASHLWVKHLAISPGDPSRIISPSLAILFFFSLSFFPTLFSSVNLLHYIFLEVDFCWSCRHYKQCLESEYMLFTLCPNYWT